MTKSSLISAALIWVFLRPTEAQLPVSLGGGTAVKEDKLTVTQRGMNHFMTGSSTEQAFAVAFYGFTNQTELCRVARQDVTANCAKAIRLYRHYALLRAVHSLTSNTSYPGAFGWEAQEGDTFIVGPDGAGECGATIALYERTLGSDGFLGPLDSVLVTDRSTALNNELDQTAVTDSWFKAPTTVRYTTKSLIGYCWTL